MDAFVASTSTVDVTGPRNPVSKKTYQDKYCLPGEQFREATGRVAAALADNDDHRRNFLKFLRSMITVPAGRVQAGAGAPRLVTMFNCFVSPIIDDSLCGHNSIMDVATKAAKTMQMGGGIGFDFSTLRPEGDPIKTLGSSSSGPISFMKIFDAVCGTIASSGHRRGAMMGTMRCDHPDIIKFIDCKTDSTTLTNFNISVTCTDKFMHAVKNDLMFDLVFEGRVRDTVHARSLWDMIMRRTWDHAEPGVLFIDRMNEMNNLWFAEKIFTTNPCSEQCLPPNGACLLGSINLAKLIRWTGSKREFDYDAYRAAIPVFVNALDNVVDLSIYPLPEQQAEAEAKRRMGIGIMGAANAIEGLGHPYGSDSYIELQDELLTILRDECYKASVERAKSRGAFPMFDKDKHLEGKFIKMLPEDIQDSIYTHGIRNSHLTSIAPTGTISLCCDNVSSGIEPVFAYQQERYVRITNDRKEKVTLSDYGFSEFGVMGRKADEISALEHVKVAAAAQKFIDSSVSKTCNVGPDVTFQEFRDVYMTAYDLGMKGCTTFRPAGLRKGILHSMDGAACTFDPMTGEKTCS